ncbi:MAG: OmpA family protein, partial [Myxococcales bacterium]|nr:OmpA family protein [Myxococcales bacterium]
GVASHLDTDSDGDGIDDQLEGRVDTDADGLPDYLDDDSSSVDTDGDGILDAVECPGLRDCLDSDGDGLPNHLDADDDGDGLPTATERPEGSDLDSDGDGLPDHLDADDDGDGLPTATERPEGSDLDSDGDGLPDHLDTDDDGDGVLTIDERPRGADVDADGDGIPDHLDAKDPPPEPREAPSGSSIDPEADSDGDGLLDGQECPDPDACPDSDGDGLPDHLDIDDDGDGLATALELRYGEQDFDGDGLVNHLDPDSDNDGRTDGIEELADSDGDGHPDFLDRGLSPTGGFSGGACSARPHPAKQHFALISILLFAALLQARRHPRRRLRSRTAAPEVSRRRQCYKALSVLLFALASATQARAQGAARLDRFLQAPAHADGFALERPNAEGHWALSTRLSLSYSRNPLVYEEQLGVADSERAALVRDHLVAQLGGALTLYDRVVFHVGVPLDLLMQSDDAAAELGAPPTDSAGFADPRFGLRVRLFGLPENTFALATGISATAPLARTLDADQRFKGEQGPTGQASLIGELRLDRVRLGLNLGVLWRETTELENLRYEPEMLARLGATWLLSPNRINLHLEGQGAMAASSEFGNRESSPLEVLAGPRFKTGDATWLGVAGGMGLTRGRGSPDLRVVATLAYSTHRDEPPPSAIIETLVEPPPEPDPPAPTDRDGDGLVDDADGCPDEPEDEDSYEDEDGCPDPDDDSDGIVDLEDSCPRVPGIEELRGCPDTDADGDGIVDRLDNCPEVAGEAKWQGCRAKQKVRIEAGRLEILERVYFRTGRAAVRRRSFALIDNVAEVLKAHPEIERVVIEGHTDNRGSRESNLKLSQARAESVKRLLLERGVEASRLQAQGFGPDRPVVQGAKSRRDHAENRRVEFIIGDHTTVQDTEQADETP